jgi:hypothetical protein
VAGASGGAAADDGLTMLAVRVSGTRIEGDPGAHQTWRGGWTLTDGGVAEAASVVSFRWGGEERWLR